MRSEQGNAAKGHRILIVDDEPALRELVRGYLEREGWQVITAPDGRTALDRAREWLPEFVVLDVMLPGIDGIEVCRGLRTFSNAYVLMLTARTEELDKLIGLAVGADDYLTKPFSPRELVARIKALARRPRTSGLKAMVAGLEVDSFRHEVRVDAMPVALTPTEFAIIDLLAASPGMVLDRPTMLAAVWGDRFDDDHLIDVHVANLRRKIGDNAEEPRFIETIRGIGYRLAEP